MALILGNPDFPANGPSRREGHRKRHRRPSTHSRWVWVMQSAAKIAFTVQAPISRSLMGSA